MTMIAAVMGCTTFNVSTDSLSSPNSPGNRVLILPGESEIDADDLLFQEFAADVALALERQGFVVVDALDDADQAVFLSYGISDPQTRTVSVPQFGRTGVSSANTTGTISSYGNSSSFSGTTTYNYNYGITGYSNVQRTQYTRLVVLTAYDVHKFLESENMVQIWRTTIVSTGSSGDLRRVFPVLIGTAEDLIGTNTGQQISRKTYESSTRVKAYRSN